MLCGAGARALTTHGRRKHPRSSTWKAQAQQWEEAQAPVVSGLLSEGTDRRHRKTPSAHGGVSD